MVTSHALTCKSIYVPICAIYTYVNQCSLRPMCHDRPFPIICFHWFSHMAVHSPTQSVFLIQVPGRDEADAIRPGPGDESQPFQNYGNFTAMACMGVSWTHLKSIWGKIWMDKHHLFNILFTDDRRWGPCNLIQDCRPLAKATRRIMRIHYISIPFHPPSIQGRVIMVV